MCGKENETKSKDVTKTCSKCCVKATIVMLYHNTATESYATSSPTTAGTGVVTSNTVGTRLSTGATQQPTSLLTSSTNDSHQNPINTNFSSTTGVKMWQL